MIRLFRVPFRAGRGEEEESPVVRPYSQGRRKFSLESGMRARRN